MILQIGILILGFAMLVKGADWFVDGAAGIATRLGIPQLVIGLTIVAMGTSLPEAAVSISSALSGNAGIGIGNVVGSNIMNILLILGITGVITNVGIQKSTTRYELPFMIGISLVFGLCGYTGGAITFWEGGLFWLLFLLFLGYLFVSSKNASQPEEAPERTLSLGKCLLGILVGGVCVAKGSDFAVEGATAIARGLGISERFIGLTIVAFGTSLPELVTSVTAARKGEVDIAIGNIVGSNIFNILFVIGTSALICSIPFDPKFLMDTAIAIACGLLLWLGTFKSRALRRPLGMGMLLSYALYFVYLCLQ